MHQIRITKSYRKEIKTRKLFEVTKVSNVDEAASKTKSNSAMIEPSEKIIQLLPTPCNMCIGIKSLGSEMCSQNYKGPPLWAKYGTSICF